MNRRERVLAALDCKPVDRVPCSFWHHFIKNEDVVDAMSDHTLVDQLYDGHRRYMEEVQPDFVKVMCDGLFHYPSEGFNTFHSVNDFDKAITIDRNNPWVKMHAESAHRISQLEEDTVYFYNVFSPSMLFRILHGQETFMAAYRENPVKMSDAFKRVGDGIINQVNALMNEGGMDGIYYCLQNQSIDEISDEEYEKYFGETDRKIMSAANDIRDRSILHICGYEGKRNRMEYYKNFDAKVYHWAANVEDTSLAEGRKMFENHCIMGGFANTASGVLHVGTEAEIKAEAKKIVTEAGREGLLLAADCSLPANMSHQHMIWVREAMEEMG